MTVRDMFRNPLFCIVFIVSTSAIVSLHTGCTRGQVLNALDLLADKIKCAVENQDMPNEAIIAKCAVRPEDVPKVLAIVGESRAATERAVARERAIAAGVIDRDAGAPDAGAADRP